MRSKTRRDCLSIILNNLQIDILPKQSPRHDRYAWPCHPPLHKGADGERCATVPFAGGLYVYDAAWYPLMELCSESAHRDFGTAEPLLLHSRPEEIFQMGDRNFIRNTVSDFFRKNQSNIVAGSFFIGKCCVCKLTG